MRDFYPDDFRRRAWLFDHFRTVGQSFAFEEVDAPMLEHAELYQFANTLVGMGVSM